MPFEKDHEFDLRNLVELMPERALACASTSNTCSCGLTPAVPTSHFMFYDWLRGLGDAMAGRHNVTTACFAPDYVATRRRPGARQSDPDHQSARSSGLARRANGRAPVMKTRACAGGKDVISYICDRERAVVGASREVAFDATRLTLKARGANAEERLGSIFSDVPIGEGDVFSRPTAGGGGFGDRSNAIRTSSSRTSRTTTSQSARRKDYGVIVPYIDANLRIRGRQAGDRGAPRQNQSRAHHQRRSIQTSWRALSQRGDRRARRDPQHALISTGDGTSPSDPHVSSARCRRRSVPSGPAG